MRAVFAPRAAVRWLRPDLLRVARDPLLVALSLLPIALALVVRIGGLAFLDPYVDARTMTAALLLLTPMMFGFVTGLLLLDERDEGVLEAVAMTPVGKRGFLIYRMAVPVVWTMAVSSAVVYAAGLLQLAPARLLVVALLAGLQAPLLAAFLGAYAPNKVAGMALTKVGSTFILAGALTAVLAPAPWRWMGVVSPHFWSVELLVAAAAPRTFAAAALAAFCVHVAVAWLLIRQFGRRLD
jgi:fluoroquinolone transport system permease protein